jgi:hypothetical protein
MLPPQTVMALTIEEKEPFFKGVEKQQKERPPSLNRGLSLL